MEEGGVVNMKKLEKNQDQDSIQPSELGVVPRSEIQEDSQLSDQQKIKLLTNLLHLYCYNVSGDLTFIVTSGITESAIKAGYNEKAVKMFMNQVFDIAKNIRKDNPLVKIGFTM